MLKSYISVTNLIDAVIVDLLILDSFLIKDRLSRPIVYSRIYSSQNSGFSCYSRQFATVQWGLKVVILPQNSDGCQYSNFTNWELKISPDNYQGILLKIFGGKSRKPVNVTLIPGHFAIYVVNWGYSKTSRDTNSQDTNLAGKRF